jgi:transposase, IS30 family
MQTYKIITYEHRVLIAQYRNEGCGPTEIGLKLSFDKSVISRELSRNSSPGNYRLYNAKQAQLRADERSKSKGRKPVIIGVTKDKIDKLLAQKWSPEQIAGRTKKDGLMLASHETIYKYVYDDKAKGGVLYKELRQTHRRRRKRRNSNKRRGIIKDRISIHDRPAVIESRTRLGDWEGDTVVGKGHKSSIGTMVDRTSKQTKIMKLTKANAKQTANKIIQKMKKSTTPVLSITLDNGKEFAEHKKIASRLKTSVFFADPYSAYQRGTNENTNGLIRQYFPKGTDFNLITHQYLRKVENSLNNRPRKSLDYLTPNEYICLPVAIKS